MLSEAQSALASIHAREYAWQEAERGFRRAIELNPNNALAHLQLGAAVLVVQGRFDEGLEEVRRAVALDPLSPYTNTEVGAALLLAGRYAEAVDQLQRPSRWTPVETDRTPHGTRPVPAGKHRRGTRQCSRDIINRGAAPADRIGWLVPKCVRAAGKGSDAPREHLQRPAEGPACLAVTYACLGDAEHALEHLEKALAEHQAGLAEIVQAPELAWMRPNARFAALRQKLNLAP